RILQQCKTLAECQRVLGVLEADKFPDDDPAGDSEGMREIRRAYGQGSLVGAKTTNDRAPLEPITMEWLSNVVKRLNKRITPGLDGVSNQMLRHSFPSLGRALLLIINGCLKLRYFPKEWKDAVAIY